ncbi:MAG: MFS transporter [Candidatus Desulfofervidaceae bacterium]|nr:MFS transporter [Candidatus Desulfofervidaceae bacterium]
MKQRVTPFYLSRFLFTVVYWTILAYLPIFLKDFGLRDDQIGLLIGCYSLASLLLMLPLGIFADILSSREILLFSTFIGASLAGLINQHLGYAWAFFISGLLSVSWALVLHFTKWKPKPV